MTDIDRIAALATIAARCEVLGEKLSAYRVPPALLVELGAIQEAVEKLLGSYDPGEAEPRGRVTTD